MKAFSSLVQWWRDTTIGFKFAAITGFMLLLILLTALIGSIALRTTLSHVKSVIITSTDIRELTLEIDRELQHARQLERAFFLQLPRIGFSQAMKSFGEPLHEQIQNVIHLTESLRVNLVDSNISQELSDAVVHLDFYLSAAQRYRRTFADAVFLVSELARENTGKQTSLTVLADIMVERLEMLQSPDLLLRFRTAQTWQNRYLATRQRSDMQASLNVLQEFETFLHTSREMPETSRGELLTILESYRYVVEQILELDWQLEDKFREFDLQIAALGPISDQLVTLARMEVDKAWVKIDQTRWNVTLLLMLAVVCAVLLGLTSALVMHRSIARKFIALASAADQIRGGNLQARAVVRSSDEIGRLAETFNTMAERIANLMQELQQRFEMSQSRLFQGVESLEEGFALFDREGGLVVANRKVVQMLPVLEGILLPGVAIQDCLAVVLNAGMVRQEDPVTWLSDQMSMFEQGTGMKLVRLADGRVLTIRYSRAQSGETVVLLEDISERVRMEEHRLDMERRLLHAQKLESLGVMAGGIAHDFNNLLSAMMGNLELALAKSALQDQARKRVEQALLAAKRASDLTRQMLAYSGKGSFDVRSLVLNELVQDNIHIFQAALAKNVRLELDLASSLPQIHADSGQVQQVIMNLITNASEAIGDRPGTMFLSTSLRYCDGACLRRSRIEERPAPGNFVQLEVRDTGCGMTEEVQSRLFDPFFSTKFTGRGLGLSAVLGIVRGHGGAIIVESAPGKGTTMQVLFPVEELEAGDAYLATEQSDPFWVVPSERQEKEAVKRPLRVLVVDDEEMVRELSVEALNHLGYAVLTAGDGVEAVKLFQMHRHQIGCVLLDLMMPNMDGAMTLVELRQIDPHIPVILCSGYTTQEVELRFSENRPSAFLQKPYTLSNLRDTLAAVLQGTS